MRVLGRLCLIGRWMGRVVMPFNSSPARYVRNRCSAGYFPYVSQLLGRYLFDMGQLHGGGVRVTAPL